MSIDARYDIAIIGSGAGGGTIARTLAPSGLRILIIERGDFIPRERENWDANAVFAEKRYLARETWYDKDDRPFSPYTHYCVGGNTKMYGAALLRMREHDFSEVRHHGGLSPAWPISYDDLEPFYTRAERMYNVHGDRGSDPCEPRATGPFPHASLQPEPRIRELFNDITALGYKPFPIPLAVRPTNSSAASSPYRFGAFDGYPDLTETKADAHVCGVRPALAHENVTLLTNARVERLETDVNGRCVTNFLIDRAGERLRIQADIVILACGAINSAALLLRSACDQHPHGLANTSDQLGRNYMTHQNGCLIAVTDEPNSSSFQKHFGLTDFYRREPGDSESLPLGTIQLMGKPDRGTLEWLRSESPAAREQVGDASIDDISKRSIDFFLTAEDLPRPENRITLRDDGGIRVAYTRNNEPAYDRLRLRLIDILTRAQARHARRAPAILHARLGVSGVSHQNGTLRFGRDPRSSVLDVNCKAHDLDNLYVADASFFPSSSAVNPSLTIMANAIRVGEIILARMGAAPASERNSASLEGALT